MKHLQALLERDLEELRSEKEAVEKRKAAAEERIKSDQDVVDECIEGIKSFEKRELDITEKLHAIKQDLQAMRIACDKYREGLDEEGQAKADSFFLAAFGIDYKAEQEAAEEEIGSTENPLSAVGT